MEDNKMSELIASLSDEQKEKILACKDLKELHALMTEDDGSLSEKMLDFVAGGKATEIYNDDKMLLRLRFFCEYSQLDMTKGTATAVRAGEELTFEDWQSRGLWREL